MFTKKRCFGILAMASFCTLFNSVHARESSIKESSDTPTTPPYPEADVNLTTPTMYANAFIENLKSNIFSNEFISIKLDTNANVPSDSSKVLSSCFTCLAYTKNNLTGKILDKSVIHIDRISDNANRQHTGARLWGKRLNPAYETPISIRLTMHIPIFSITNSEGNKKIIVATKQALETIAAETSSPENLITVDNYIFEGEATVQLKLSISALREISIYKGHTTNISHLFDLENMKSSPYPTNTTFKICKGALGLDEGACLAQAVISISAPDSTWAKPVIDVLEKSIIETLRPLTTENINERPIMIK